MAHLQLIPSHVRWEEPRKVNVISHFHDEVPSSPVSAQASLGNTSPCHPPLATFRLATGYNNLQARLEKTTNDTEQYPLCNNDMDAKQPAAHTHNMQCVQNIEKHQQQTYACWTA
jgi:hypothetical protein